MPKAVQFDSYGGIDVLEVRDVPRPVPGAGEVLVEVRPAGINPSEAVIRSGAVHHIFPATFPSGQGSDFAGVVAELGPGLSGFTVGDEVIGFSMRRSSQAEYVTVPANQLTPRPASVPWEVAGSLFVAGVTAYAAVQAVLVRSRFNSPDAPGPRSSESPVPDRGKRALLRCTVIILLRCTIFILFVSKEDWSRSLGSVAPHPVADKLISLFLRQVD
jgi:NADPH:quinone reductase-like Zn-dependent oxidoreductase